MSELLPCPFCGGPASIENVKGKAVDELRRSAGCDNEECHGYMSMQTYPRIADAVKAWNTRHPEPAQAQVTDADLYELLACVRAVAEERAGGHWRWAQAIIDQWPTTLSASLPDGRS